MSNSRRYSAALARSIARSDQPINLGIMNPRYRRMVIPGALVALIVIVAVAALVRG
jgi:hypothetical protein